MSLPGGHGSLVWCGGGVGGGVGPLSDVQGAELGPFLPSATKLRQGHVFTPIYLYTTGEGGCLPQCMLGYTPWADTPIPPGQTPPAAGTHPTEMHSCVTRVLVRQLLSNLTRNHLLHSGKCWLCYL